MKVFTVAWGKRTHAAPPVPWRRRHEDLAGLRLRLDPPYKKNSLEIEPAFPA
jgi:hypothetical protein